MAEWVCWKREFVFFIFKECASGSGTGSKINLKAQFSHSMWVFIQLYIRMGLTYITIKSILGSRHSFNMSERHSKRFLSASGLSRRKAYFDLARSRRTASFPSPNHHFFSLCPFRDYVKKKKHQMQHERHCLIIGSCNMSGFHPMSVPLKGRSEG